MDTLLGLRQWKWHATDWTAAAVSGFAAGAVLMVLDLVWSALFNPDGPWRTSHMIAPIFLGASSASQGYPFSVLVVAIALAGRPSSSRCDMIQATPRPNRMPSA